MKRFIKRFISIIRPERPYHRGDFLVVDNSQHATHWGGFLDGTPITAFKCDEFATLEEAKEHVENKVPKNDLRFIEIYQKLKS